MDKNVSNKSPLSSTPASRKYEAPRVLKKRPFTRATLVSGGGSPGSATGVITVTP